MKRLFNPRILAVLAAVAGLHVAIWAVAFRPVAAPDFQGRVAGLAFSPFQRGQSPEAGTWPSVDQIDVALARAAGISGAVRSYSVQNGLDRVPELARRHGLSVMLGSWLDRNPAANADEIARLVRAAQANRNVTAVLVGNEVVLRGDLTVAQLISHVRQVKAAVHQPVSTAEPWHVWLANPELGQAVDFITVHLLPYWEGIAVEDALRFSLEKLAAVQRAFPGKRVVIGEIGWPSAGRDIGAARASVVNQAGFLRAFFVEAQRRGLEYFVMEAFDQPWKTPFEGQAGGYWGMFDLDGAAKWPLAGRLVENPAWPAWAGVATLAAFLLSLGLLSRRPDMRLGGQLLMAGLTQGFVATLVLVGMAMAGHYLSAWAAGVWLGLAAGQLLLLVLLLADSFELAENVFGRVWRRRAPPLPVVARADLPKVSLHVPICNEPPAMVCATLDALAALDYPDFEVLVIDNNTTDPALWEKVARHCAWLGPRFRFFHLGKWPGFKAGALNFALGQTAPDATIIGVLDSDYMVDPAWLRRTVPHFTDPRVGFVQAPQDYRDGAANAFKRMMYWEYAGFFHVGMVSRNERNAIIQHGTMTLVRKGALGGADGWAEWCICEDAELGLKLFERGWQAVYVNESLGRGVMPDDFAAYRKQRSRWAYGAAQIVKRHARALFNPRDTRLTPGQRWHFVMGWLPWLGDALGLGFLLAGLAWSVGLVVAPNRFDFPIVLFMLPALLLFGFKLLQVGLLYRARVPCGWRDALGAAVAGLGLTHTIGKAVWAGLFTRHAPFLRTPKMANAPALVQGLVMAREEALLLLASWGAALGVAIAHRLATQEAVLWCAVLLVQGVPYLAAVGTSLVAAWPAARPVATQLPASAPRNAIARGIGAGD